MLDKADAYVARMGLDLPLDPAAREMWLEPACLIHQIPTLDLNQAGIRAIIWATGFRRDYSWIRWNAFEGADAPIHRRGVSSEAGFIFLAFRGNRGLDRPLLWGGWHDAKFIADQIDIQRSYEAYEGNAQCGLSLAA